MVFEPTLSFAAKLEVDRNIDHNIKIRKKTHKDTKCSWTQRIDHGEGIKSGRQAIAL